LSPGEVWRDAFNAMTPAMRASMAKWLQVDANDEYALRPFTPYSDGDRYWVAAITLPCPLNEPECLLWQPEHADVILISGGGEMRLLGDNGGTLVAPAALGEDDVRLYVDGRTFARDWAAARAAHGIDMALDTSLRCEPSGQPGIALCGDLSSVVDFSPLRAAERVLVDNPRLVKPVTAALLRSAALPIIETLPPRLRIVV